MVRQSWLKKEGSANVMTTGFLLVPSASSAAAAAPPAAPPMPPTAAVANGEAPPKTGMGLERPLLTAA